MTLCVISFLVISEFSNLYLVSVAAQAGLSLTWSKIPKKDFLVTRFISIMFSMFVYQRLFCHFREPLHYLHNLILVTRKPVFGVCDQSRLKPACSATKTSKKLEILDIETRGIILSKQRITRALTRLRRCAGWSAPLLFAYGYNRFSHDVAPSLYYKKTRYVTMTLSRYCLTRVLTWI